MTRLMRARAVTALLFMCGSGVALAQTTPSPSAAAQASDVTPSGDWVRRIDFGVRVGTVTGDAARWQRYRDLRDGPTINRLDFSRETNAWWLKATADHVGYRDQRFQVEAARIGRVRARFMWDQIPLFISEDTLTLYSVESPGTLRVADTIQNGIQSGAFTMREAAANAFNVVTRTRRHNAIGEVTYRATPDTDLSMTVTTSKRDGAIPYGGSFGHSSAIELPLPIDSLTTNVGTGLEWANRTALVRVNWDGSFYTNNIQTVIWDNPVRLTDIATAPGQGRMPLWPTNRFNTVSSAASVRLPVRSRLTGSVALGWMDQNEALVPNTINPALSAAPLPRTTADASGRTAATYLAFTSRPVQRVLFSARHRFYEFENTTPPFHRTGHVAFDTNARVEADEPHTYSMSRQTLDVDATATVGVASVKVGYSLHGGDRTSRHYESSTEHAFRSSVDLTGSGPFTLRAQYERARRKADELNLQPLEAAAEQITMRQFDIANRDRSRGTIIAFVTPREGFDVQASLAAGRDEYTETGIGLRDNSHFVYSLGVDVTPRDNVSAGLSYSFEEYDALINQNQATSLAQATDPTRRWDVDTDDRAHNVLARLELPRLLPKTDVRMDYDYSRARVTFLYSLPPGSALAVPEQLPPVKHAEHRAQIGFLHHLTTRLGLGLDYWYDRYDVQDFALGGEIDQGIAFPILEPGQPGTVTAVLLNYLYRPFRGHTAFLRATYAF